MPCPVLRRVSVLVISAYAGIAQLSLADESAVSAERPADEIVVVANKSARSVREVAAHVTVVNREQLAADIAVSAADIFRYTPGIDSEESGTRFGSEGITIRGIGGNRVAMILDGVPLPEQFSVGSFSNATRDFLNAGLLQRIEVLHGPGSALYGSNAIGGVVAATTPDPATVAGRSGTGGELGYLQHDADRSEHGIGLAALSNKQWGVLLGASYRDGAEMSSALAPRIDQRDYQRRSALVKLKFDSAATGSWGLNMIHQDSATDSELVSFLGVGRFRSTTALHGDDRNRMQLLSGTWEFGSGEQWFDDGVLRIYQQSSWTQQKTLDERASASRPVAINRLFEFKQSVRGGELVLHRQLETGDTQHRLSAGIEYREQSTEEFRDGLETGLVDGVASSVILGEAFPLRDFPNSETSEWGLFAEDTLRIGNWTFLAGVRMDRYKLRPLDDAVFAEDYPFITPVPISEADLSPKLAVTYRHGDRMDLYLQYAQGFRAPPYADANIGLELPVFNIRAVPNPELRSEHSAGIEAGIRWQGEWLQLHVAWFRTDYEDFIESRVRIGTDPDSGRILFQARNLREARIDGIEAGWELALPADIQLDGSLYRARGENRESGTYLNSVGPAQAVLGVSWQPLDRAYSARLQVTATEAWERRDETVAALFKPPGHIVLDLYGSRTVGEHLTLRAGVRNILDRTWWNWSSVRGLSPDDVLIPYVAQPGRNFGLSAHYSW